jgi:hypothetical protein
MEIKTKQESKAIGQRKTQNINNKGQKKERDER